MTLAYDGTRYLGWQKTNFDPAQPSVEYTIQSVLEQILQHPVPIQAASRTDRGVHAEGQVINCVIQDATLDLEKLHRGLNSLLPDDIRILSCTKAEETFHATLATKAKQYIYRIYTGPTLLPALRFTHWHMPDTLDREKMATGAHILLGEHNFIAFRNHRKGKEYNDTVRTIFSIDLHDATANVLEIKITANNFLYKMCRNIVGTLVYVAQGKISPGTLATILANGKRADAGITAPACGLCLHKVFYTPVSTPTNHYGMQ